MIPHAYPDDHFVRRGAVLEAYWELEVALARMGDRRIAETEIALHGVLLSLTPADRRRVVSYLDKMTRRELY